MGICVGTSWIRCESSICLVVIVLHSVGQSEDGAASSDDGYPDDQRSEPVDEHGIEEGANDTGEDSICVSAFGLIDI